MRTVKLRFGTKTQLTIFAAPDSPLGAVTDSIGVYAVHNVPSTVSDSTVLQWFKNTAIPNLAHLSKPWCIYYSQRKGLGG